MPCQLNTCPFNCMNHYSCFSFCFVFMSCFTSNDNKKLNFINTTVFFHVLGTSSGIPTQGSNPKTGLIDEIYRTPVIFNFQFLYQTLAFLCISLLCISQVLRNYVRWKGKRSVFKMYIKHVLNHVVVNLVTFNLV